MYITTPAFIEYTTSHEFRAAFRRQFGMDEDKIIKELDALYGGDARAVLDAESLDELLMDEGRMSAVMNDIFTKTEKNPEFCELYTLGAAKWISEDLGVGQCILCTYDYFYLYHSCLCVFFDSPSQWNAACPYYVQLRDKLMLK
jgi:hypothetical protein